MGLHKHPVAGGDKEVAHQHEYRGEGDDVEEIEEDRVFPDEADGFVPFAVQEGEQTVFARIEYGREHRPRKEERRIRDEVESVAGREFARIVKEGRIAVRVDVREERREPFRRVGRGSVEVVKAGDGHDYRRAYNCGGDGVAADENVDERPDEYARRIAMQYAEGDSYAADAEKTFRRIRRAGVEHRHAGENESAADVGARERAGSAGDREKDEYDHSVRYAARFAVVEPRAPAAESRAVARHAAAEPRRTEVAAEQHGKVVQDHEQYAKTAQKIYLPYALFGARRDESDFRVFGYEKGRVGHLLSFFHSVLTSASPFPRFS